MAMPAPTLPYYTADLVRALPDDGQRYELVHGKLLVTPAPRPRHQRILGELYTVLRAFLARHPVGQVLWSPADISWGPDTLVQPDIFVIPARLARAERWEEIRELLLVVEVLSPSTEDHDRHWKRRLYQERGIPLYWILDPDARQAEVWTPADAFPRLERERLSWHPEGAAEPCVVELGEIWEG